LANLRFSAARMWTGDAVSGLRPRSFRRNFAKQGLFTHAGEIGARKKSR
jgi:hypothetical protein